MALTQEYTIIAEFFGALSPLVNFIDDFNAAVYAMQTEFYAHVGSLEVNRKRRFDHETPQVKTIGIVYSNEIVASGKGSFILALLWRCSGLRLTSYISF